MPTASAAGLLDNSVTTAKLKTSEQSQSVSVPALGYANFLLSGGQYIFYPTIRGSNAYLRFDRCTTVLSAAVYQSYIGVYNTYASSAFTAYCKQRYVTTSGEIVWLFILREILSKKIISMSIAPDHPCFGNENFEMINHPFTNIDLLTQEIICVNPSLKQFDEMDDRSIVENKPDRDILDVITEDYEMIETDNLNYPDIPVSIGLPKRIIKNGKKVIVDYRFLDAGTSVQPTKKLIIKPSYITVKRLRLKP